MRLLKGFEGSLIPRNHCSFCFIRFHLAASEESIVLDSFSGSGTTRHSVLQANKRDSGNRCFILVEMVRCIPRHVRSLLVY